MLLIAGGLAPATMWAEELVEQWVVRYGKGSFDVGQAVVVDAAGDVVVTGRSSVIGNTKPVAYTAKYAGADGSLLWEVRSTPESSGEAMALALDSTGNVVIAGREDSELYVAKYAAADGALLWERRNASNPLINADEGRAVAVDGAGNVIVAGGAFSQADGFDYYTAKYAGATGAVLWEKVYGDPSGNFDELRALAVDAAGNAIVTGYTRNSSNEEDYYTIKYAAGDGSVAWAARYDGPSDEFSFRDDDARSVQVDASGNVLVAGNSDGLLHVVKYAVANGALLWERRAADAIQLSDPAPLLAVDAAGNALVAGVMRNIDPEDPTAYNPNEVYAAKYRAADGAILWESEPAPAISEQVVPRAVVADSAGNFVVTTRDPGGNMWTITYAGTDGIVMAEKRFNGTGNLEDDPSGVAVDAQGRVIVTGSSRGLDGTDRVTIKYGPAAEVTAMPFLAESPVPGEPEGTVFLDFGPPAMDEGRLGGTALIQTPDGKKQRVIFGGPEKRVIVRTALAGEAAGSNFASLGEPVFADTDMRFLGRQPGAEKTALYTQPEAPTNSGGTPGGLRLLRVASLNRPAPGVSPSSGSGGLFKQFPSFALPKLRPGLLFTGRLSVGGDVTRRNDFGLWREVATEEGSELALRKGATLNLPGGDRMLTGVVFALPVANASDQRRSYAPDGGISAIAKFSNGRSGLILVAPDGTASVPVDTASPVPDENGVLPIPGERGIPVVEDATFTAIRPPATASGGRHAFEAALRRIAAGRPPRNSQAIFAQRDGTLRRVLERGDAVPGGNGARFGTLGQPLMGQSGMIGLVAALTGQGVTKRSNRAVVQIRDNETNEKVVVARLGQVAPEIDGEAAYRRFKSVVVTDTAEARILFTATVGGGSVTAKTNQGLWCVTPSGGVRLLLRSGSEIQIGGVPLAVKLFTSLEAPRANMGQGRATDATGFVAAKVKLADGRYGVLRLPLP